MRHPDVPMDGKKPARSSSSPPEAPDELLRILIGQLAPAVPEQLRVQESPDVSSDEIVLDVELDGYRYLLVRTPKSSRAHIELSPREKEIVRMVAQGHPNKIIADVLNISSWTVCTHLRRVFAKLGVGSRAAMVARMHEMGAIRPSANHALARVPAVSGSIDAVKDDLNKREPPAKLSNLPAARRQSA